VDRGNCKGNGERCDDATPSSGRFLNWHIRPEQVSKLLYNSFVEFKPMNPFLEEQQIDELIPFDWDEEQTKFEVEDYYDDLAFGLPLESGNDF
jgi:hypothetical protein